MNGINGRLPVLLRWLTEEQSDIVVLQELKAPQETFPEVAIRDRNLARAEELERCRHAQ